MASVLHPSLQHWQVPLAAAAPDNKEGQGGSPAGSSRGPLAAQLAPAPPLGPWRGGVLIAHERVRGNNYRRRSSLMWRGS